MTRSGPTIRQAASGQPHSRRNSRHTSAGHDVVRFRHIGLILRKTMRRRDFSRFAVAARGARSSRRCSYAAVLLSLGEVRYLIHVT